MIQISFAINNSFCQDLLSQEIRNQWELKDLSLELTEAVSAVEIEEVSVEEIEEVVVEASEVVIEVASEVAIEVASVVQTEEAEEDSVEVVIDLLINLKMIFNMFIFVYGTLMNDQVLNCLNLKPISRKPAVLNGFKRISVAN